VRHLTRPAGAVESVPDRVAHDVSADRVPLSVSERTMGFAGCEARLGADADGATLARAALVGQVWAQREIWFRFAPMVYGIFLRALGPRHDHDDLTQEVFLRIFRKLHTLEKASAIRSFAYSVAVRVLSEEIRRFTCRRRIMEQRPALSTPSTSSPANFEIRETMECVQRCLDGMDDKCRAVFVLRYLDGMKSKEVALDLGISQTSVKRYLAKARAFIYQFRSNLDTATRSRFFGGGQ
jgi:RNA polymerase sigma-70 factor (ECF subfamily)